MSSRTVVAGVVAAFWTFCPQISVADTIVTMPDDRLSVSALSPGSRRTDVVRLHNPSDGPVGIAVQVVVTEDDENGCVPAESQVATEQCEADGGELDDWLEIAVSREGEQLWTGTLSDLAEPRALPRLLPAAATWGLDLTVAIPHASGNEVMTDRLAFDLRVTAVEDPSGTPGG